MNIGDTLLEDGSYFFYGADATSCGAGQSVHCGNTRGQARALIERRPSLTRPVDKRPSLDERSRRAFSPAIGRWPSRRLLTRLVACM